MRILVAGRPGPGRRTCTPSRHELAQALLAGRRDASGAADEDGRSEFDEAEQAAARSIKPDESVEDGPEETPTDAESG